MRRLLGPACAGALALTVSACDNLKPPAANGSPPAAVQAVAQAVTPAEIGDPLFPPAPVPPRTQAPAGAAMSDPIIVRQCQVTALETQNVPSKNPGRLLYYCTDIQPGEARPPEDQIIKHPRTHKEYRRLKEGDAIKPGQLIGFLDDKLAAANMQIEVATQTANEAKKEAAIQLRVASDEEYQMYLRLWKSGAGSESDVRRGKAQYQRAVADVADAEGQLLKSKEEFNKARVVLDEHEVRSTIGGVVQRFYRRPGESVKELEPVAEIRNDNKARVEGQLDVQYLPVLTLARMAGKTLKAVIEPAFHFGPKAELPGHLQAVRAVAVSKDPRKPLIVSGGEDRTARVWDPATRSQLATLEHPMPVRAVACTPPAAEANLCLTGADDGIARVWDLDNLTAAKPLRELKGRHQGNVVCAAFAPDGKTCVTADKDDINLWDVGTGELKYRFPKHHRGPIQSVQYTPQAKLVSAARDKSLCVWALGEKGAAVETTIDYRAGGVPVLGVSPDGQRVLFDQERELSVLTLPDKRNEGTMPAPSEASKFSTFALFSPDGRLVLAGGTADNPLQLWKAPAPGVRGHLLLRLVAGPTSAPTCGAFAPDGSFAVTGSEDNKVVVWAMPPKSYIDRQITGTVTFLDQTIDPADRKARIWAEPDNPEAAKLLPGDTVTLVIPTPEGR